LTASKVGWLNWEFVITYQFFLVIDLFERFVLGTYKLKREHIQKSRFFAVVYPLMVSKYLTLQEVDFYARHQSIPMKCTCLFFSLGQARINCFFTVVANLPLRTIEVAVMFVAGTYTDIKNGA
jgi:hypothetical protein